MKLIRYMAYLYHTIMRRLNRRKGRYQTAKFEYHHNKRKDYKGLLLIAVVLFILSPTAKADFQSDEQQSIQTAQKLIQATVKIDKGSGVYISKDLIITNYHVIKSLDHKIVFTTSKDVKCTADLVRQEEASDLALFRTDCYNGDFLTMQETSYVGQTVIVAGNPSGFDFSVSKGIVSAQRSERLQFDAKINYGSSGGVVANLSGEIIGITVEKSLQEQNINFAIPAQRVNQFIQRAKE